MPTLFLMENVYTIERTEHLARAVDIFKKAGYGLTQRIIDASRIGVPQMRRRLFLIGHRLTKDDFFGNILDTGMSLRRTTVRDYFGDSLNVEYYYAHPRNYNRRAIFSVDEPAATIRRVNRPIPASYKAHPADKCAATGQLRNLTTSERALLQTFPPSFLFSGTTAEKEQQIGNAVPVLLARYVGSKILTALSEKTQEVR
jgi:DNA (cytosine-5)-methyltransferase 1